MIVESIKPKDIFFRYGAFLPAALKTIAKTQKLALLKQFEFLKALVLIKSHKSPKIHHLGFIPLKALTSRSFFILIYTFLLICMALSSVSAGVFDNVGLNARPLGMGEAFTAVEGSLDSVNYNPAGLADLEAAQLMFSYRDFYGLGLVTQKYAGFSVPQEYFNIGFSWHRVGTTGSVDFLDYDEDTFIVTVAGWIGAYRDLCVGANLKFFRVNSDSDASGYGFDAGIRYSVLYRRLKFGLFCKDINDSKISWDTGADDLLKKEYVGGVSYEVLEPVLLAIDYSSSKKMNLGSEIMLLDERIMLRGGVKNIGSQENVLSTGMSFKLNNIKFDYALSRHKDLGLTHFFTLNVGLKKVKL